MGGRCEGSILRFLTGLPLPSSPARVSWVETTASYAAPSPQVPAHGAGGGREYSAVPDRSTAIITPDDGGMGRDAGGITGVITTGTGARGGGGEVRRAVDAAASIIWHRGGVGLRRVAFRRKPALSFGNVTLPPNRWTPVAHLLHRR